MLRRLEEQQQWLAGRTGDRSGSGETHEQARRNLTVASSASRRRVYWQQTSSWARHWGELRAGRRARDPGCVGGPSEKRHQKLRLKAKAGVATRDNAEAQRGRQRGGQRKGHG